MPLRLRRRKGSPNWYIRGTVRGTPVEESSGTDNRDAAEAYRIKREAEILNRSIFGARATATFLEAAAVYLESAKPAERKYVKKLVDHFGETPLARIDQEAIERCAAKLYPGVGPATINRQVLGPLAAVIHMAARRGLAEWVKVAKRREPKARNRWLRPDEAESLIDHAPERIRPLVVFLFSTGCRLGEALSLDWRNVDLKRRRVVFEDTKNDDDRGAVLTERAFLELANLDHREGLVFPIPRPSVYYPWALMCKAAGVENFRPHDCRHTWATWMRAEAGLDLRGLMQAGGWRDHKSVIRYTHVNPDDLKAAYGRLTFGKKPRRKRNSA